LRASVGSNEAILPERPRSLSCAFGACWAPHPAHFLASHEGDRAASFKNRHPMVGEPDSSGSMSSQVRSELHGVGRPKAILAYRRVPGTPWDGLERETVAISGESAEPGRNGDHRRQPYGHQKCRSHPGQGRATDVNWVAMGKIGKAVWWSLSLGPAFAAQALDHLIARLLSHTHSAPV
jgi:hypothetical protein